MPLPIDLFDFPCHPWSLSFSHVILRLSLNLSRIRKVLENKSNMEDDRVAIIEAQLAQAKQIADEADRKYEEVKRRGDGLNQGCHISRRGSPGS
jgi:hypothetical protein